MPVEERAMVHQQVFELAARMPEPGPWNLEARTGPRHRRSRRKLAIYESDIEPRVVRHDEIASLERSKNGSFIENLARQIVIGQTGQPDDFRFQGAARILAPGLRFRMVALVLVRVVAVLAEPRHRELLLLTLLGDGVGNGSHFSKRTGMAGLSISSFVTGSRRFW